jgi:hypothetical protein
MIYDRRFQDHCLKQKSINTLNIYTTIISLELHLKEYGSRICVLQMLFVKCQHKLWAVIHMEWIALHFSSWQVCSMQYMVLHADKLTI